MSNKNKKQLSNPFSTGGGGGHFEAYVQASFVALMLSGGFAPCLPCWPIRKVKLQGRFAGYTTDDLIVFTEHPTNGQKRKMLGQVKHSLSITETNKVFREVIQAAWNDFKNDELFDTNNDVIALITGPLNTSDTNDARTILEWARHSENAEEFFTKVKLAKFSSQKKRGKLEAFRTNLCFANGNSPVSDSDLFHFLKHYHILGYDLDIKAGVTLSLFHTLIGLHSHENVQALWTQLVDEVQTANKNAGTISLENLSEGIKAAFKQPNYVVIPSEFTTPQLSSSQPIWSQHPNISDLVTANLVGAWDEHNEGDLEILQKLSGEEYHTWIQRIREILLLPESPIALKNGRWCVVERKSLWTALGARLFDDNLEKFKQCAVTVLTERDPKFQLPIEERHLATIHGKVLVRSHNIRKGMTETLALLATQPGVLNNCSRGKPETTAALSIRKIFEAADWVLWGSLDNLLPILAEVVPNEFLNTVDSALQQSPCPFKMLFSQESAGITGANYLTGLLWALETLAWDETLLVRVSVILGNLASHDPGGNYVNRPAHSLRTIFLPWRPQTIASIEKRKAALTTLQSEEPEVAWKLMLALLPSPHQVTLGTHKPAWRNTIPEDWDYKVSRLEYQEQTIFSAELAVSLASHDLAKLKELIDHFEKLPRLSLHKVLEHLNLLTEETCSELESEYLGIWNKLNDFVSKHRQYPDAKWALSPDVISQLEPVIAKLAPKNPSNLYQYLFNGGAYRLYQDIPSWEERHQTLQESRQKAIQEILDFEGIDEVFQFAESVKLPTYVGNALAEVAESTIDGFVLPTFLGMENNNLEQFVSGYVWRRQYIHGWEWVDGLNKSDWSATQIGQFLSYLPFTEGAWSRAATWLRKSEQEYWKSINANPTFYIESGLETAIDKLIEFGRPYVALNILSSILFNKQPLNPSQCIKALLAAISSPEPSASIEAYQILEIIEVIQEDSRTEPNDLCNVEWAYLPLLERHHSPKTLENKLASDPEFFCEVIRLIYCSKNEDQSSKETSENDKSIATNAWRLLENWRTPPGKQTQGDFSGEHFSRWLAHVTEECAKSGHLEVALIHIGHVLFYCPPSEQGLWIDEAVATALNSRDAEMMREAFRTEAFNSRGAYLVDPTGEAERKLANKYRHMAEDIENAGYHRFAVTMRDLADSYMRDADRVVDQHSELRNLQ